MTSKGLTQHHKAAELLPQGELAKEFANGVGAPFKLNLDVLGDPSNGKVFSGEDKITLHNIQISGNGESVQRTNAVADNNAGKLTQQEQDERDNFRAALDAQTRRYCDDLQRIADDLRRQAAELRESAAEKEKLAQLEFDQVAILSAKKEKLDEAIREKNLEKAKSALKDAGYDIPAGASDEEIFKKAKEKSRELQPQIEEHYRKGNNYLQGSIKDKNKAQSNEDRANEIDEGIAQVKQEATVEGARDKYEQITAEQAAWAEKHVSDVKDPEQRDSVLATALKADAAEQMPEIAAAQSTVTTKPSI